MKLTTLITAAVFALPSTATALEVWNLAKHKDWVVNQAETVSGEMSCTALTQNKPHAMFLTVTKPSGAITAYLRTAGWNFGTGKDNIVIGFDQTSEWDMKVTARGDTLEFIIPASPTGRDFLTDMSKGNRIYVDAMGHGGWDYSLSLSGVTDAINTFVDCRENL